MVITLCLTLSLSLSLVPTGSPSSGGDVVVYVKDINQSSMPTPFYSVLVSVPIFTTLSAEFYSINCSNNYSLSHSVLLFLFLPYWSFHLYVSIINVSLSPDVILCGWLGLKHQVTNSTPPLSFTLCLGESGAVLYKVCTGSVIVWDWLINVVHRDCVLCV